VVADRLRWANPFRFEFTAYPAKVRVARLLVKITLAYGRRTPTGLEIGFELTQSELASLCGAAEVTVQKALRDLRRDGSIITGYRTGPSNGRGIGWEFVHVCIDDASRIAFSRVMPNEKKGSAVAFLKAALA